MDLIIKIFTLTLPALFGFVLGAMYMERKMMKMFKESLNTVRDSLNK